MTDDLREIFNQTQNLDERSMQFLIKAIQKNNIQGFDYIEFKQSLMKLKSMNMDEDIAIKSAFATASTMGLDKDTLINSAKHYKNVLVKEKEEFDTALENQIQSRVSHKKSQAEKLQSKIGELEQKINEIKSKIQEYHAHIEKTETEIKKADDKIRETKQKFEVTHEQILAEIESDINNFSQKI